ncbi:FeoA family protein [Celerinatantimonas sp. YJH-8]|uniref:FeoA family protein n=1 Tax=Celerinatantimonas sp. YJH-8 TaxID=3228714 RepID=UPI0038C9E158
MSEIVPLGQARINQLLRVVRVEASQQEVVHRLQDLNIRRGSQIRIYQRYPNAPLMLAVGDARVAIDSELSKTIFVSHQ